MTVTMSAKRANIRLFISFLFCIVGALILAPSALADSQTDEQLADLQAAYDDAQYVYETYFNSEGSLDDDYVIIYGHDWTSDGVDNGLRTCIIPKSQLNDGNGGKVVTLGIGSTSSGKISLEGTFMGNSNPNFYIGHDTTFVRKPSDYLLWSIPSVTYAPMESPKQYYGNYSDVSLYRVNNARNGYINYTQIAFAPPIDTNSQTYSDALIYQYIVENGIDVDSTAWIILNSGQPVQIPISYDTPVNYDGDFYLRKEQYTPYLVRFVPVVLNADYDVSAYRNAKLCVYYNFNCSKLRFYSLYDNLSYQPTMDMWDDLPRNSVITANNYNAVPDYYTFGAVSYIGKCYTVDYEANTSIPLYLSWDMSFNWLSAIPKLNNIYVGIDITILDDNGNAVIGRDTTSYNTFITNYNQRAIAGLTGSITGRTSFSGDWRGQNVNTSIDYNNNWSMPTDTNVTSLFSRVFSMGNGYVTTAVLGVLAIAFCAYLLYGKH